MNESKSKSYAKRALTLDAVFVTLGVIVLVLVGMLSKNAIKNYIDARYAMSVNELSGRTTPSGQVPGGGQNVGLNGTTIPSDGALITGTDTTASTSPAVVTTQPVATTVPVSSNTTEAERLVPGSFRDESGVLYYTVQPKDTLTGIAEKFDVSEEAIIRKNDIADPENIQKFSIIVIPAKGEEIKDEKGLGLINTGSDMMVKGDSYESSLTVVFSAEKLTEIFRKISSAVKYEAFMNNEARQKSGLTIYLDPWQIPEDMKADYMVYNEEYNDNITYTPVYRDTVSSSVSGSIAATPQPFKPSNTTNATTVSVKPQPVTTVTLTVPVTTETITYTEISETTETITSEIIVPVTSEEFTEESATATEEESVTVPETVTESETPVITVPQPVTVTVSLETTSGQ